MDAQVAPPTPVEMELLKARAHIFSLQREIADLSLKLSMRDLAAAEAALKAASGEPGPDAAAQP